MPAKPFNFWPLSIAGFIGVVVLLIVWTVYFALQNPVQRDDSFLTSYQEADALMNRIQEDQKNLPPHTRSNGKAQMPLCHVQKAIRAGKISPLFLRHYNSKMVLHL